ncbi:MAG: SseB family protein [Tepidisphaeraceae bacterium]
MAFFDPIFHQPRAPANPRLLKALATASGSNDLAVKNGLYEALLNSVLLIPTTSTPQDGSTPSTTSLPLSRGRKQQFLLIEDEQGAAVPGFTDLQAMQRWQPGATGFVSMPLPQLLRESFPSACTGIWLNVADRSARFVSRAELAQFTGGMVQATYVEQVERDLVPPHTQFDAKLPETLLPGEVVLRIVEVLKHEPDIASGYVLHVEPGVKRGRVALGLRLVRLLEPPIVEALLKRVMIGINQSKLHRGGAIDVLVLDYAKFKSIAGAVPPVYEKA